MANLGLLLEVSSLRTLLSRPICSNRLAPPHSLLVLSSPMLSLFSLSYLSLYNCPSKAASFLSVYDPLRSFPFLSLLKRVGHIIFCQPSPPMIYFFKSLSILITDPPSSPPSSPPTNPSPIAPFPQKRGTPLGNTPPWTSSSSRSRHNLSH